MSPLERRRHSRQPISISALVHPPEGRSWLCNIRDFCPEGMLLTASNGNQRLSEMVKPADLLALHFSVATPNGQQHFRTQAVVARLLDGGGGIGVRFHAGLPDEAQQALMKFSAASGMAVLDEDDEDDEEEELIENSHYLDDASESDANDGPSQQADAVHASTTNGAAQTQESSPAKPKKTAKTKGKAKKQADTLPEKFLRDRRISQEQAAELRQRVYRVCQRALQRICNQMFATVQNELLTKARDAGTNAMQMMYFEGLDLIEKQEAPLREQFTEAVLSQIENVSDLDDMLERRRRRESGNTTKLELVDNDEFEEWLAMAEIISKAENRYNDALLDVRAQLGLIAKPWGHKDVVPVGPSSICWAFEESVKPLALRRQVRHELFASFELAMMPVLGNIYAAINQLLEESGAFPSLEDLREALVQGQIKRSSSGVRVEPQVYQEMDTAVREAALAADGIHPSRPGFNPFDEVGGTPQAVSTARNILNVNRTSREAVTGKRDAMLATQDTPEHELFDESEILHAMSVIEQEVGNQPITGDGLKPRLMEVLHNQHGDKSFSEKDFDTLDVMGGLVGSLREDQLITDGIRQWIERLELTLHKLATRDSEFLEHDPNEPHSAVRMLNQLARLGNARDSKDGIDREVGRKVDELLERVVNEFDSNPDVFDEVVDELNPLVDRQTRAYRGNVERTVRASEGQQKLARARRAVVDEISTRLEGKEVPELALQLLNPGWRNLLVHTHLRRGQDSNEWRDNLATVDKVIDQLSGQVEPGDASYVDPDQLLKGVVAGLNGISFDPSKRTPLVMKLSSALVGDTAGEKSPVSFSQVPVGTTATALGLDGLLPDSNPELQTDDANVRESWAKAIERARRIQVGEWLATSDSQGRPLILTVAYVGDESSNFVLVNRKGIKTRELSLKELGDGLHTGQITLLDDYDLPLMERASQRMLENMHSQLAHQASHDDLTQLINRKEFERGVEQAIASARHGDMQHALLYMDLDQFKIINNTSGHTAGDELLKQIGDALTRSLVDSDCTIARLGGDEFGVLLRDVETDDARGTSEQVLGTIREQRFEWEERFYTLSASIGLVFVDASTESVDVAMRHADEACYAAKDAGRNRMQEYELGDSRMMQRHGIMEWVTQLDKALDDERLVLNCQRIAPTGSNSNVTGLNDHFEILLTMQDELGDMMPPSEFIQAAETYNRMGTVDRWVISHVMDWIAAHRAELDKCGGFSINVSGHSVNDETFPDFVLEQFARTQAPTGKICFEITETAAIANLDNAIDFMNRMKIIGCKFSLDDFGTGLSSYSYLRNLPVDFVKIDGVFVRDIVDNPGDYAVVRSINEIGHYMGKKTIAEFVENDAVLEKLREIGVDYVQGYGIDRPQPLSELRL